MLEIAILVRILYMSNNPCSDGFTRHLIYKIQFIKYQILLNHVFGSFPKTYGGNNNKRYNNT